MSYLCGEMAIQAGRLKTSFSAYCAVTYVDSHGASAGLSQAIFQIVTGARYRTHAFDMSVMLL